jgi:hypothetical protein
MEGLIEVLISPGFLFFYVIQVEAILNFFCWRESKENNEVPIS